MSDYAIWFGAVAGVLALSRMRDWRGRKLLTGTAVVVVLFGALWNVIAYLDRMP